MFNALKVLVMIVAVISIMIALVLSIVTAAFPDTPFARSTANWVLIASPSLPMALFYCLDRFTEK